MWPKAFDAISGASTRGPRGSSCSRAPTGSLRPSRRHWPLLPSLGVGVDRAGRIEVEPDLSIRGHPEVFAVGDAAAVKRDDGTLVPGVAPAAMQEGVHAANNILATIGGRPRSAFRYRNKGDLATIGRHRAIADFGFLRVTGYPAWLLWLFVHILYLAGFRNRLSVLIEWAYAYWTYQRGTRLITHSRVEPRETATGGWGIARPVGKG